MNTQPSVKSTMELIQRMQDAAGDPDSYGVSIFVDAHSQFVARIVRKFGPVVVRGDTIEQCLDSLVGKMINPS